MSSSRSPGAEQSPLQPPSQQRRSQQQGAADAAAQRTPAAIVPGEDPGTLADENQLCSEGADAVDAASAEPHPETRRDQIKDTARSGGAEDRSQSI